MLVKDEISNLMAHMYGIKLPLYRIEKDIWLDPGGMVILPTGVIS
jgi:hypothetical protein